MACASCKEVFRGQFRKKCFTFQVTDYRSLLTFAWWPHQRLGPRIAYTIYRTIVFAYFFAWWIVVLQDGSLGMTQLTNLTFTVLSLYFTWGAGLTIVRLGIDWKKLKTGDIAPAEQEDSTETKEPIPDDQDVKKDAGTVEKNGVIVKDDEPEEAIDDYESWKMVPWDLLIQWLVYSILLAVTMFITIVYWSFLFPFSGAATGVYDLHVHLFNSLIMIVDLLVSAIPVRFAHFIYALAYAFCYLVFSLIYYAVTKLALYSILDWGSSITILTCVGFFLLLTALMLAAFGIYLARECCIKKRNKKKQNQMG